MPDSENSPPFLGAASRSIPAPEANLESASSEQDLVTLNNPIQGDDHQSKVVQASATSRHDASRLRDQLLRARRFTVGGSSHDISPNRKSQLNGPQNNPAATETVAINSRRGSLGTLDDRDSSSGSAEIRAGKAARRASYQSSTLHWHDLADSFRFGSRQRSATAPGEPTSEPKFGRSPSAPTTPEKGTGRRINSSPIRTSPITSSPIVAFRAAFKGPILSSIPASPMSPPSFGIVRSASSPPMLPSVPCTSPLLPIQLDTARPMIELEQTSAAPSWFSRHDQASTEGYPFPVYTRAQFATSAPHLTISIPAQAPLPAENATDALDTPFDSDDETEANSEALFNAVGNDAGRARDKNRYHALLELVETESAYLESIRVLVNVYFQTLPFLVTLSSQEIATIIRNAEDLLSLHARIVSRLGQVELELGWKRSENQRGDARASRNVRRAAGCVARVFLEELPNFSLYNDFCARHSEAMDVVRSIAGRPEWEAYERQCARLSQASPGDQTPLAVQGKSPFFASTPTLHSTSTPTLVGSPPTSPVEPDTPQSYDPSHERHLTGVASTVRHESVSQTTRSKLRFADYAIAPVQRICRYPLIFGAVLKHLEEDDDLEERQALSEVWDGFKQIAEGVDVAKKEREGELRTQIVAARMEFIAPTYSAFCDILGPTLLVGTLHYLHRSNAPENLRVKYYGCFLYRSHLVISKIKKRDSYEPREWLPLRIFEITNVDDGEGLLPFGIRLSHRDHIFELGASSEEEKMVWLDRLLAVQAQAKQTWSQQALDSNGQPTLFDDTVVSSISAHPSPLNGSTNLPRRNHSRTNSVASIVLAVNRGYEEPTAPVPESPVITTLPSLPPLTSQHSHTSNRHRLSATANSLLGRTPAVQRAAIDLRLGDVLSEEILSARAHALRDVDASAKMARSGSTSLRSRTLSGPKRSMTAQVSASAKMLAMDKRRMSLYDLPTTVSFAHGDFVPHEARPATEVDQSSREPSERKWSTPLRKAKSGGGSHSGKARPDLPDIDTALVETMRKSGTWSAKAVRRAASHSSLTGRPARVTPVMPSATAVADVERNNSVSSTASSSGTGTNSSSSHNSHYLGIGGSAYSTETPPSSIPPSPDCQPINLEQLNAKFAGSVPASPAASHSSRWNAQSLGDNVSNALRLKKRGSILGFGDAHQTGAGIGIGINTMPPQFTDEHVRPAAPERGSSGESELNGSAGPAGTSIHRRASTRLGGFFSKRVQSSPTLSNLFAAASLNGQSAATHAGSSGPNRRAGLTSSSSPHLMLPAPVGLSRQSSIVDDDGSPNSSGSNSPEHALYVSTSRSRAGHKSSSTAESTSAPMSASSSMSSGNTVSTHRNKSMRSLFRLTPIS